MSPSAQKRLAIAAAITVTVVFIAANARFLQVALRSQPACVENVDAPPAKRAC